MTATSKPRTAPAARPIAKTAPAVEIVDEPSATEIERDKELLEAELLADLPKLKRPEKLRIRERNRLMAIVLRFDDLRLEVGDVIDEDDDTPASREKSLAVLDVVADIDDFAESIARDPEAYADWSADQRPDAFLAILNRYSVALGK